MLKSELGRLGENIAAKYLQSKNYEVIGQNQRQGHKEIDIICRLNGLIIFVEVKTVNSFSLIQPEDQLSAKKIRRLKKAALNFCFAQKINLNQIRNDLIAIRLNSQEKIANIKHFKNIF